MASRTEASAAAVPGTAAQPAKTHAVTFDRYSFLIDGKRTYLWSGEVHPYRLPSPELWPDIFQKMKAAGFNTASIYFSWGYHSPREGVYAHSPLLEAGPRPLDHVSSARPNAAKLAAVAVPAPLDEPDANGAVR